MLPLLISVRYGRTNSSCSANAEGKAERCQHFVDGANKILSLLEIVDRCEAHQDERLRFMVLNSNENGLAYGRRPHIVLTYSEIVPLLFQCTDGSALGHLEKVSSECISWEKYLTVAEFAEQSNATLESPALWNPHAGSETRPVHISVEDLVNYRTALHAAVCGEILSLPSSTSTTETGSTSQPALQQAKGRSSITRFLVHFLMF